MALGSYDSSNSSGRSSATADCDARPGQLEEVGIVEGGSIRPCRLRDSLVRSGMLDNEERDAFLDGRAFVDRGAVGEISDALRFVPGADLFDCLVLGGSTNFNSSSSGPTSPLVVKLQPVRSLAQRTQRSLLGARNSRIHVWPSETQRSHLIEIE